MTKQTSNSILRNLTDVYFLVEEEMNKELIDNGYRRITLRTFKSVIKTYWKEMCRRIVYNYESVEIYPQRGVLTGNKIYCTQFNPRAIDINKTDGYYYFINWDKPMKYRNAKLKPCSMWKKRQYRNVVDNGADYPELMEY